MNTRVRHVFVIPRDKKGLNKIFAYFNLFKRLFNERYDLLAHFSVDWRGAILARLLHVDISVSRLTDRRGAFWHKSFDFLAPTLDDERPMAEQDVDLLRSANLYKKSVAPAYELNISSLQKTKVNVWLKKHDIHAKNKLVVIHASSRWKFKEIPVSTWAQIIDELHSKKIDIVISGSHDDLKTNEMIFNLCESKPLLTTGFSLEDTAALYKQANLVLTIDSMSTHFASALKTPVISIFGPTNEKIWGPWKVKNSVISMSSIDDPVFTCRPCGQDGCEGSKISQCLVQLNSRMILSEVYNFLKF
ncbi:RfaF ADP-heptose,LPS heptosyltransferase [Candidatus Methylopumilus universalis]|uniref:glycosyltransferase family 9 protein n=1 Tax=Candidatus Methylopumilus universalis TaxID=2588536 RepID=UPI003BEF1690